MKLQEFNEASSESALALISHWCAAPRWAQKVSDLRPYLTIQQLDATAREHWLATNETDCLRAFAAHPAIGDVELLRSRYATQANAEQGQVLEAEDAIIEQLATQNVAYHARHGFTFIVFATGKSAAQMLDLLNQRINNSRAKEIENAKIEQLKIMQLRLQQAFTSATHPETSSQPHAQ